MATTAEAAPFEADDFAQIEDVEALSLSDLLERPVVAASRYAQRPGSSPTLVGAVDHEQLERLGYRTLGEAMRMMRGVYLSNDRNYSYLGLSGFNVPGDYNSRIALSVDNHLINDAVYGQASPGLELGIPLIAVDHIELVRGGALSVYGQNALLGAIQIVTATGASRPGLRVQATANATAETFQDGAGRPTIAPRAQDIAASYGAVGHGYDLFAAAQYSYDPGLAALAIPDLATNPDVVCVDALHRPIACDGVTRGGDAEETAGAFAALRGKRLAFHALAASRRKQSSTAAFYTLYGDQLETRDDRIFVDGEYTVAQARYDLESKLAFDYYHYAGSYPYHAPREGFEELPASFYYNTDSARSIGVTGELRGRYKWPTIGRHLSDVEVALGGLATFATGAQRNADQLPEGELLYIDRDDPQRVFALAGHVSGRAFEHLVGFAALRADYYPDAFGRSISPQGGLVLDGGERGRIRASIGRGLRAPNLYETYFGNDGQMVNAALGPERSETRTISVERYLGRHARLIALAYSQRITDLIGIVSDGAGNRMFVNQGTSTGKGVELELEARWDATVLRANAALQRSIDDAGAERVNSPRLLANLVALIPLRSATLAFESSYVGARRTLGGNSIDPAFLSNVAVTFPDVFAQVDLTLGMRNVFDVRTFDPGSEEHFEDRIPMDPRTIWVRLAIDLGRAPGGGR
jgi:outer membrane receptor for ferrienterochelin and colicins